MNGKLCILLLICSSIFCLGKEENHERPNIIIILADDMGYGDARCNNPESPIPTPQIDRIAAEGLRFTDAHTPSAVCTPTRYGLLTGRYAWRTRLKEKVVSQYGMPLIEADRLTLPKMLGQQGYATACIGKWHLGMEWVRKDGKVASPETNFQPDEEICLSEPIKAGPLTAGFDYYYGIDIAAQPPYGFIENDRLVSPIPDIQKPDTMYGKPGRMQKGWRFDAILPTLAEKSVEFLHNHVQENPNQPFFLYLSLNAPHIPIAPSEPYVGVTNSTAYGDFVYEVNACVGDVLKALDDLKIQEETLIIFTSDNGSPDRSGVDMIGPIGSNSKISGHHPNTPWRGLKGDIYEGGHRVPFVARWPGHLPKNEVSTDLFCLTDIMATIAELTGYALPRDVAEDSRDLSPAFLGREVDESIRKDVVLHSWLGLFAIRVGDWKLIEGTGSGGFSTFIEPEVLPGEGVPPGQLYNMREDPKESVNLYFDHPEIVERLSHLLTDRKHDYRDRIRHSRNEPTQKP